VINVKDSRHNSRRLLRVNLYVSKPVYLLVPNPGDQSRDWKIVPRIAIPKHDPDQANSPHPKIGLQASTASHSLVTSTKSTSHSTFAVVACPGLAAIAHWPCAVGSAARQSNRQTVKITFII